MIYVKSYNLAFKALHIHCNALTLRIVRNTFFTYINCVNVNIDTPHLVDVSTSANKSLLMKCLVYQSNNLDQSLVTTKVYDV